MSLSNFEIENICNDLKLNCIGVFSKDRLPADKKVGTYFVNMESYNDGDGTHWVCFRLFPNRKVIYFDSFGMPPPQEILDWTHSFKPIATNNRQIQDVKSSLCGWFCICLDYFFTYDICSNNVFDEFENFLSIWSPDTKKNDKIVKDILDNNNIEI